MSKTSTSTHAQDDARRLQANRACAIALLFLSGAIFCFTIGIFSTSPESILGIAFLCLGLLAMAGCIVYFARYNALSK